MLNSNHLTQGNTYEVPPRLFSFSSKSIATDNSTTNTVTTNDSCQLYGDNISAVVNHHNEQPHAVDFEHSDPFEIARRQKFDLTIPTENEKPDKKLDLKRKSFAIVCRTNMTMGNYIEDGKFQSVRSRVGIKWSKTLQNKCKATKKQSKKQSQQISKQVVDDFISNMKASIEDGIDRAKKDSRIECADERN
ncbi:unnamed protein product, partial [Adineta steineri]